MVNNRTNIIRTLLYPASCILCGAPGAGDLDICAGCRRELPVNRLCCSRCAVPIAAAAGPGTICGKCLVRPPKFDLCIAPYRYQAPIDSLITGFKFQQKLSNGRLLSLLLLDFLKRSAPVWPEIIIPVPLHRKRVTERGFNQALELARPISRHFSLPLELSSCIRKHPTAPQMNLEQSSRRQNIKGAFEIRGSIGFRHVALLDDVVTTGATASELAALLKKQGVERVDVWALARTPC